MAAQAKRGGGRKDADWLGEYERKRDFTATGEPQGSGAIPVRGPC